MPPTAKRRKVMAGVKRPTITLAIQQGIQIYGKISKSQVQGSGKSTLGKNGDSTVSHGKNIATPGSSKKQKWVSTAKESEAENCESGYNAEGKPDLVIKRNSNRPSVEIRPFEKSLFDGKKTASPRKRSISRVNDTTTPTKGARTFLETLDLQTSYPSTPASSSTENNNDTPPSSPPSVVDEPSNRYAADSLPDELQDLVELHSSFLTVLSLHYAHNGPTIPVDLRDLTPGIEQVWRRRRVVAEDFQRLIALERREHPGGRDGKEAGTLYLSDYGHGKICVEIADSQRSHNSQRRPVDEEGLNTIFIQNLGQQWSSYKAAHPNTPSPASVISLLPLSPLTPCTSLSKMAPLHSKGQRRLEDLKAGAIKAQKAPLKTTTANTTLTPQQSKIKSTARSTDLFSRLKAKQLHQSSLPPPPSLETLARKSALQRLTEISPVLESLALSSKMHCNGDAGAEVGKERTARVSLTMPTLVQHLQMSLRNPIGKEEVGRCAILLAEVAPEWVGVRKVGRLEVVTIKGKGIGRGELGQRVERICGEL